MAIARPLQSLLVAGLLIGLLSTGGLSAERPVALNELQQAESENKARGGKKGQDKQVDSADEAAAIAFVKQHHAELANLLRVLRDRNRSQYRAAIGDLTRARLRLEQIRRRSEPRYEMELHAWQVKSRIGLMTARLRMKDTPAIRKELTAALQEQAELRRSNLQAERQRVQERLKHIQRQLDRLDEDPAAEAQQQLKQILNRIDR